MKIRRRQKKKRKTMEQFYRKMSKVKKTMRLKQTIKLTKPRFICFTEVN